MKAYAFVVCHEACGQVALSEAEYDRQMSRPDSGWMCPQCGAPASFDDEAYEALHYEVDDQ